MTTVVERMLAMDSEDSSASADSVAAPGQQRQQQAAAGKLGAAAPALALGKAAAAGVPLLAVSATAAGTTSSPLRSSLFSVKGAAAAAAGEAAAAAAQEQHVGAPPPAAEPSAVWGPGPGPAPQRQQQQQQGRPSVELADRTGLALLQRLERLGSSQTRSVTVELLPLLEGPAAAAEAGAEGGDVVAAEAAAAASRQELAELRRQVAAMRLTAAPRERSLVQEAGAAASCRWLLGSLGPSPDARAAFVAADGVSALRELLDSPSERVLLPALNCLLALTRQDEVACQVACLLGLVPTTLRYGAGHYPAELRLAAAEFAQVGGAATLLRGCCFAALCPRCVWCGRSTYRCAPPARSSKQS